MPSVFVQTAPLMECCTRDGATSNSVIFVFHDWPRSPRGAAIRVAAVVVVMNGYGLMFGPTRDYPDLILFRRNADPSSIFNRAKSYDECLVIKAFGQGDKIGRAAGR